jgi:hypothetical protein
MKEQDWGLNVEQDWGLDPSVDEGIYYISADEGWLD